MIAFKELYQLRSKLTLFGTSGKAIPRRTKLAKSLKEGSLLLPKSYIDHYATPLENHLDHLLQSESAKRLEAYALEALTGAVYQHTQGFGPAVPLTRFLAVISNLFRSFLSDEKRAKIHLPLLESLPPLAMFQHKGSHGPFILTVDWIKQLMGASVAVVSLPATCAQHPVFWGSLAHEVGGHAVSCADKGLLGELARRIPRAFAGMPTPAGVSRRQLDRLWSYWIDEAVADVYGILNVGPAFIFSHAVVFAAIPPHDKKAGPKLRMESLFDPGDPSKELDPHPTDILRLDLAAGAVAALSRLSATTRNSYINHIESLSRTLATGKRIIIDGNIFRERDHPEAMRFKLSLSEMQRAARRVGTFIATTKLTALGGHSIQDIETWDDSDEAHSMRVKSALLNGKAIAHLGDDAHLLAGSFMALLEKPVLYRSVTAALNDGLDLSFQRDPIWGRPRIRPVVVRY
jgi:hypothetical protein